MKRLVAACLLWTAAALPARAHFVWITPTDKGDVLVLFSDNLQPDTRVPVTRIQVRHLRGYPGERIDGARVPLQLDEAANVYRAPRPARPLTLLTSDLVIGVVQKGTEEPVKHVYAAKAILGTWAKGLPELDLLWGTGSDLDVAPVQGGTLSAMLVKWKGKPLPGAEVTILVPGAEKPLKIKSDEEGLVALPVSEAGGLYGVLASHGQAIAGEFEGKKYTAVRYHTTLTFRTGGRGSRARGATGAAPNVDPAATKLLADARAARATWENFPGFRADLEVNSDGKIARGKVEVSAEGKVTLELPDADEKVVAWARRELSSLVGHRLDSSAERNTPCAFIDDNSTHPLGRAIRVLNDELHSSYRIRDREVVEVNRTMGSGQFTITVLESRLTPEKKYLPVAYVVNNWDLQGNLTSSSAHHQTWLRVGGFDLPEAVTISTAFGIAGGPLVQVRQARTLRLGNHQLLR